MTSPFQAKDLLPLLEGFSPKIQGLPDRQFFKLAGFENPSDQTLVVAPDLKDVKSAIEAQAAVVITSQKHQPALAENDFPDTTLVFVSSPNLALIRIAEKFASQNPRNQKVQWKIQMPLSVDQTAEVHPEAYLSPGVVIGPRSKIGKGTWIGANTVINNDVEIGENCTIHELVSIGSRTIIGDRSIIRPHTTIGGEGFGFAQTPEGKHLRIPQMGRVVLENDVEIGANCTVDRAAFSETRIGQGTKIDNISHIAHNCQIGQHCLLTGGFMVAGSSNLGNHVMTGGRVTVTDHVTVAAQVMIAGLSAVSKDITEKGTYGGHPLQNLQDYFKTTASLPKLPTLRREVTRLKDMIEKALKGSKDLSP